MDLNPPAALSSTSKAPLLARLAALGVAPEVLARAADEDHHVLAQVVNCLEHHPWLLASSTDTASDPLPTAETRA